MRGVISGAMLMALHALGFKTAFDAVYGASAGACRRAPLSPLLLLLFSNCRLLTSTASSMGEEHR